MSHFLLCLFVSLVHWLSSDTITTGSWSHLEPYWRIRLGAVTSPTIQPRSRTILLPLLFLNLKRDLGVRHFDSSCKDAKNGGWSVTASFNEEDIETLISHTTNTNNGRKGKIIKEILFIENKFYWEKNFLYIFFKRLLVTFQTRLVWQS